MSEERMTDKCESELGLVLGFFTLSATLHFFFLQFWADPRTRDAMAHVVNIQMMPSFYVTSVVKIISVILWALSAWGLWMDLGFEKTLATMFFLFALLILDNICYALLFVSKSLKPAAIFAVITAAVSLIIFVVILFQSAAGFLFFFFVLTEMYQAFSFWRYSRANATVKFKNLPGRWRENSQRATADAIFQPDEQNPDDYAVEIKTDEPKSRLLADTKESFALGSSASEDLT